MLNELAGYSSFSIVGNVSVFNRRETTAYSM